ncbi:hypothetical protein ABZ743_09015 [Streptomyces sp. NPDC006662]|uniref:hypothetical protein n=1 Tax=Streptomyces sp. NPDC006662 TaxID=3156902 RepID=UPI0033D2CB84
MSEQDDIVQPGIAPTARPTAGSMFAALHGELVPYAWHHPASEHDAYQLFHQRSLAMGWLDDRAGTEEGNASGRRSRVAPGLWGMNNAGGGHPLVAPDPNLISWFHVEASALADDRPLPVQPFLRCAQETTERIDAVRLTAVQVLLPVQGIDHRPTASVRASSNTVASQVITPWPMYGRLRESCPVAQTDHDGHRGGLPRTPRQRPGHRWQVR